jgi:tetratricopeptide (TPR) repeat protein
VAANEDKRSRRAKRRAAESDTDAPAPAQESSEASSAADEDEDEGDEDEAAEEAPDSERGARKGKSKAAKATDEIRDRNRRIREQAAQRRRSQREKESGVRAATGLDASEMVDDAFARSTHALSTWIRGHFNLVQIAIVLVLVGGVGWQIYSYVHGKTVAKTSDALAAAVETELARVGAPPPQVPGDTPLPESRPRFPDDSARLQAAEEAYKKAAQQKPGSGAALLAELGIAGVAYDQARYDEAKGAYEKVKASPLAAQDTDVRGRATEGVGLCLEAKKDIDGALKTFRELENSDLPGFSALGLYHQARLLYAKGDKNKAKEFLVKVLEKLDKIPQLANGQLAEVAADLLRLIDPKAAPSKPAGMPGMPGMPPNFSVEQLERLQEQIKKNPAHLKKLLEEMGVQGGDNPLNDPANLPVPPEPPAPAPAPAGSK